MLKYLQLSKMCLKKLLKRLKRRKYEDDDDNSKGDILDNVINSVVYEENSDPNVIIVGAGAAGLTCAMHLLNNGLKNIHILEAEQRIGGRIHTIPFGGNVIDLGAQFVHGEKGNAVFQAVKHLNVLDTTTDIYNNYECIRSNGEVVSKNITDILKKAASGIVEDEISDSYRTLNDYISVRFFECLEPLKIDFYKNGNEIAKEFYENFVKLEYAHTNHGLEEMSLKSIIDYQQCEGDYMLNWKDTGFISFLRLLIRSNSDKMLGDLQGRILFGCTVERIEWDCCDGKARVICKDNTEAYLADHVVLTVPLGVLKECVDTLFKPPLPIPKKRAIIGLGYACTCKIFVEFSDIFWPNEWAGFLTLWRKNDLEQLRNSTYSWLEDIFSVYRVKYQPRTLQAWVVGVNVSKIEKLPMEELKIGILKLLNAFLKSWIIPEPISIEVTRWATHPNFRGSYSFHSMLTEELKVTPLDLQHPLEVITDNTTTSNNSLKTHSSKPIVQFAGEATSEKHFSTVHGAIESGYREANRILELYTRCFYNYEGAK